MYAIFSDRRFNAQKDTQTDRRMDGRSLYCCRVGLYLFSLQSVIGVGYETTSYLMPRSYIVRYADGILLIAPSIRLQLQSFSHLLKCSSVS